MEIITSHINADFDALASMVAAKKLYPDAEIVFPGSQERKLRDFIEVFSPISITRLRDLDLSLVNKIIIVDTKQPGRIGPLAELLQKKNLKIHVYDHHPFTKGDIRGELEKIEDVGATATIFTEILKNRKLPPTPMEATIMALGIYEETGCLLFPSTTERDLLAASYLLRKGANLNIVSSYLKMEFMNAEELDLLNELIKSSEATVIRGLRVVVAKASRDTYFGDAAHLAHRIMDMEDIDAAVVLLNMEGKILLIARSRAPELDVAELLKEFGGGGHPTAASATIREASTEVVEDRLRQLLTQHVKPGKTASDIMTSPVITIPWDSTIKEAEDTLTRYGVNVLPVVRDRAYCGVISRETVEKALFHGFQKHKCSEFSTADAMTVGPDAPIREVETRMIEQNQRFMPVIRDGVLVGAITRTDLLRVLYEEFLRRRRIDKDDVRERPAQGRNLAAWLKERFPEEIYRFLKLSGEVAQLMGMNAYLVGGSVRDLLLGKENLDIDIVIEGDGIGFARTIAERLNAKVRTHQRFGTAHISTADIHADIATARTEYYESPAALPKVETSSIKRDLYRRDFTINTLAIKLNEREFGLLIDFFGGQRDLREKTIRVLHNLSYIEDPTRAFRAIRFAERFGFKLSRHTEQLIKSAVDLDLFDKLSGSRLYDELLLAFNETNPVRTLKRFSGFGLLRVIHRNLIFNEKLEATLSAMYETISWYNLLFLDEQVEAGLLYLMALLSNLTDNERLEALQRLSAPPKIRQVISRSISESSEILRRLPLDDPAEIYHLLIHIDTAIILFSMAVARDIRKKRGLSHFLVGLRKVRPLLKGDDLQKLGIPPGPRYAAVFRALLDEKLMGKLKTEEDEKRFVLERFKG